MSDFRHFPSQDEVRRLDPRWVSDMKLAHTIYSHQGNNSFEMQMMEQLESKHGKRDLDDNDSHNPLGDDDSDDNSGLMPLGEAPKPRRPRR